VSDGGDQVAVVLAGIATLFANFAATRVLRCISYNPRLAANGVTRGNAAFPANECFLRGRRRI
jgi:hypothetical protein